MSLLSGQFARAERRGIWLGMEKFEIWIAVGGMLLAVVVASNTPMPGGFFAAVFIVILAALIVLPRVRGDSLVAWVRRFAKFRIAEFTGQNEFVYSMQEVEEMSRRSSSKTDMEQFWLALPGGGAAIEVFEMVDGTAMIYDAKRQRAGFVVRLRSEGFALANEEEQESRVQAFSQVMAGFSAHPGVARVQILDRTVVQPPADMLSAFEEAAAKSNHVSLADPFAEIAYKELLARASQLTFHEQFMTVMLSTRALKDQISALGGGLDGIAASLETEMRALPQDLTRAGAQVENYLTPRELAAVIRGAFDPDSVTDVAARRGDFAGVSPESAGPMGAMRRWDRLATDGVLHQTFIISEWPRRQVLAGFLHPLIFAGEFRHTVTLVAEPINVAKAMKAVDSARQDYESMENIRRGMKVRPSSKHAAILDDLDAREGDLLDGHGEVRFAGLITITADDEAGLAAGRAELQHAAARSMVEIRLAYGQQYEAFLAAAVPLGLGLEQ